MLGTGLLQIAATLLTAVGSPIEINNWQVWPQMLAPKAGLVTQAELDTAGKLACLCAS